MREWTIPGFLPGFPRGFLGVRRRRAAARATRRGPGPHRLLPAVSRPPDRLPARDHGPALARGRGAVRLLDPARAPALDGREAEGDRGAAGQAPRSTSRVIWQTPAVAVAAAAVLALFVIVRGVGPGTTPMEVGPQRVQASVAITLPEVPSSSESRAERKISPGRVRRIVAARPRSGATPLRRIPWNRRWPAPKRRATIS